MERLDAIEVEVEFVFDDGRYSGHVVGRRLEMPGPVFRVTPESTIGGCSIQSLDLPPRALDAQGNPRFDLLGFRLSARSDCGRFKRGQRVLVENIRLIKDEDPAA